MTFLTIGGRFVLIIDTMLVLITGVMTEVGSITHGTWYVISGYVCLCLVGDYSR